MAHVTGGGLTGNVPRILPPFCQATVKSQSWPIPPIFHIIQEAGQVEQQEMFRVFNMGIGLIVVVPQEEVDTILGILKESGTEGYIVGEIRERPEGTPPISFVD